MLLSLQCACSSREVLSEHTAFLSPPRSLDQPFSNISVSKLLCTLKMIELLFIWFISIYYIRN